MDLYPVAFWSILFSCLTGLALMLPRLRIGGKGWAALYFVLLLIDVAGGIKHSAALVYGSALAWLGLVLLPALLVRGYHLHLLAQDFASAGRLARIIGCLHPADGWWEQPKLSRALELAQRDDLPAALESLSRLRANPSMVGFIANAWWFQLSQQWKELLAWYTGLPTFAQHHPHLIQTSLRALGETGDRRGMIDFYHHHRRRITRFAPQTERDKTRLLLFAFCGHTRSVEDCFRGGLSRWPAAMREFWLATSEFFAGDPAAALQRLRALPSLPDARLRHEVERRVAQLASPPPTADPAVEAELSILKTEQAHDAKFATQPTLFSKAARATQLLIGLNLAMFTAEILVGGTTDPATLYGLGALAPMAVRAGDWSRLATSIFLHWGALHLVMNMLGLWVLAPFVERALQSRRFLFLYLVAGMGSMGMLVVLAPPESSELAAGASGSVMGLVGATGAILLRGWRREKAFVARRRLLAILAIVATQTLFDALIPQVSMTAHLSGAAIGFIVAWLIHPPATPAATPAADAIQE